MVTHSLSDIAKFMYSVDSKSTKFGLVTNTGMQKDLRGSDGSTGEDDLLLSSNGSTGACSRRSIGLAVVSYIVKAYLGVFLIQPF
jgi:hypothetical protein